MKRNYQRSYLPLSTELNFFTKLRYKEERGILVKFMTRERLAKAMKISIYTLRQLELGNEPKSRAIKRKIDEFKRRAGLED